MKEKPLKVLLADHHDVVRAGIRSMVEEKGWQVCAEAANGKEAVKLAIETKPDVVVLEFDIPELEGLSVTRQIKKHSPRIEIVIFTAHDNDHIVREVLAAGARGFVLKSESGRKLMQAIESASQHEPFFAARASEILLKTITKPISGADEPLLTYRERQIVQLLAGGSSNKEVGVALGISVKTVETHRARIMRKLGLSSIVKLVRFAVREHIIRA
jgi:DNA-binding NarL/FixJ family response regulator